MKREEVQAILDYVDHLGAYWAAQAGGASTVRFAPLELEQANQAKDRLLALAEDEDDGSYESPPQDALDTMTDGSLPFVADDLFTDGAISRYLFGLEEPAPETPRPSVWTENAAFRELTRAGAIEPVAYPLVEADAGGDFLTLDLGPTEYFYDSPGTEPEDE